MARIFGDPSPPRKITEKQFDDAQADLVATASKPWHQIDQSDYWHYLLDLCYVELQQDLFDYLFPAFLIKWWEGQLDRRGGPESECDFYRAIDHGEVFTKMMGETRRNEVFHWIVDAYMDGVDAWDGHLSVAYVKDGPDNLHGPLWSFNALGQSVPVLSALIERLSEVSTIGRAQWWLVLGSGILWKENECPAIPSWTPVGGGGGVYLTGSAASIFDHGYLPAKSRGDQRVSGLPTPCKHAKAKLGDDPVVPARRLGTGRVRRVLEPTRKSREQDRQVHARPCSSSSGGSQR